MKKIILFLSILGLSACSKDRLPQYYKLDGLRILALHLDIPEVQKNDSAETLNFQLTPYVSDIGGSGDILLETQTCLDAGVSRGADPECNTSITSTTLSFVDAERTGPTAAPIPLSIQVPASFLAGYSQALRHNGVSYLVVVKATRGTQSVSSYRRILFSSKTPNQNPTLSDFLANGSTLNALPSSLVRLSFASTGGPENYSYMNGDGVLLDRTEKFETTWFLSDGELSVPRTYVDETAEWTPPSSAPVGRSVVVVGVLRDKRGGVSVMIKKL